MFRHKQKYEGSGGGAAAAGAGGLWLGQEQRRGGGCSVHCAAKIKQAAASAATHDTQHIL